LPAEESESSSADETSAAPCWRHYSTRLKFMVPMRGIKVVEALRTPNDRVQALLVGGSQDGFMVRKQV